MRKNNLIKLGLFITGLAGAVLSGYSYQRIYGYTENDKLRRYLQLERINRTLDDANKQADDINFEFDDLKMRQSLSEAYDISNKQLNNLYQDSEIRESLLKQERVDKDKFVFAVGMSLLLSTIFYSGVKLIDKIYKNKLESKCSTELKI